MWNTSSLEKNTCLRFSSAASGVVGALLLERGGIFLSKAGNEIPMRKTPSLVIIILAFLLPAGWPAASHVRTTARLSGPPDPVLNEVHFISFHKFHDNYVPFTPHQEMLLEV